MEYSFLSTTDEALIEGAKLPLDGGVALALFTTGYNTEYDEAVSLSIVDMAGAELFSKVVKPHNIDSWNASEASGGIGPDNVVDSQALYEFEDEIVEILENADFVLTQHLDFVKAMLDRSWIALPTKVQVDVCEMFRLSHCSAGYPGEPATVATLEGIVEYYGLAADRGNATGVARAIVNTYKTLVGEFIEQRDAKGADYWQAYEERLAAEKEANGNAQTVEQIRERRYQQMNALLWVAAGLIFTSLVIQLYQNGGDIGFMLVAGAAAVFAFVRAVVNWRKK